LLQTKSLLNQEGFVLLHRQTGKKEMDVMSVLDKKDQAAVENNGKEKREQNDSDIEDLSPGCPS